MNRTRKLFVLLVLVFASSGLTFAQQPEGPQASAPPPVAPETRPAVARREGTSDKITVPAGTRVAVVLENGISTRSAKAGDSLYFRTSFPITQNNHVVVPVGSYLRGELLESKRPGRIKGRGEFRMRLNTLIFPNGYTVDLNAAPRSADTGGKETMDPEGKVTGPGGKGNTRGPEAELPRGSTLDIVLEHALALDADQVQYRHVGDFSPITPPPARPE